MNVIMYVQKCTIFPIFPNNSYSKNFQIIILKNQLIASAFDKSFSNAVKELFYAIEKT